MHAVSILTGKTKFHVYSSLMSNTKTKIHSGVAFDIEKTTYAIRENPIAFVFFSHILYSLYLYLFIYLFYAY